MATDDEYMAFLDKANRDLDDARAAGSGSGETGAPLKTTDAGADVPPEIAAAAHDAFYVSDADEPFVPVALRWEGGEMPDAATFADLIQYADPSAVTAQAVDAWDPRGQYAAVTAAVRGATAAVQVFVVPRPGARVEYWVVGPAAGAALLVGVKALAVES